MENNKKIIPKEDKQGTMSEAIKQVIRESRITENKTQNIKLIKNVL